MTQKELEQILGLISAEVSRQLDTREKQATDTKKATKKVKEIA
jgi:hypothetical protein